MAAISMPIHAVRVYALALPLFTAMVVLFFYGLFALAGTHDYMAWNRVRWQALTDLMEKDHISHQHIDGGFEFNGWYAYDAKYEQNSSKSWWWVEDDSYVISFGQIAGYEEIKRYPFHRWMPIGQGNIFVLKRMPTSVNEVSLIR